MSDIISFLTLAAEKYNAKPAVICDQRVLSYSELYTQAKSLAQELQQIVATGKNIIGIYMPNDLEYLTLFFAILMTNNIPLLIDYNFSEGELLYLNSLGVNQFVTSHQHCFPIKNVSSKNIFDNSLVYKSTHAVPVIFKLNENTAICRLTSGSTGKPKCMEFCETAVINAASNWVNATKMSQDDKILSLAALSNGLAFNTSLLSTIMTGATLYLTKGYLIPSNIIDMIGKQQITRLIAFPTFYRLLSRSIARCQAKCESLQYIISSGSDLPLIIKDKILDMTGIKMTDYYGIAEVGPVTFPQLIDSTGVGQALMNTQIKIAHPDSENKGEIYVKTNSMATGYLNFPGEFTKYIDNTGFYKTGDLGILDIKGNLTVCGRINNVIKVAGRNIDLTEVLQVIGEIKEITDAAIIADKDKHQEPVAHLFVVTKKLKKLDIIHLLKNKLANYKIPAKISVVTHIKRNGVGKPMLY